MLHDVEVAGPHARQEPRRLRRQGRLHRQHAAVRLPQPRGLDVRAPLRHPRGHRRRHAVRLRLPDGPAGAARPDRPRHGVRDPGHDVQAGPRPPARARADPQADGHRRHARPQDRPRLLHLRGAGQPDRRRRRTRPRPPTTSRSCSHDIKRVGVVGTGTMATRHRRGLREGGVRRACTSAAVQDKVDGVLATIEQDPRQGDPARQATEERPRPRCSARLHRHHLARRPQGRRHRGRGHRRGPRDQDHAVREPRRDLQARARSWRRPRPVAADHRAGQGDQAAAGRHRHALLQPGPDHEAGRGRVDRGHRRARSPRPPGPCARRSARSRSRAATGPGSSSTRCCSPTSTTRSRCSRRTTRPPTTSTSP